VYVCRKSIHSINVQVCIIVGHWDTTSVAMCSGMSDVNLIYITISI
jgi:hypothetical protein